MAEIQEEIPGKEEKLVHQGPMLLGDMPSLHIPSPKTCWEKIDFFMWKEQYPLSYQHMHGAPWANTHALGVFRVLCCIFLWSLSLYHLISNKTPTLIYFTNWGIFFSTATYTFFALFTVR
jgi:hypothetical protein